MQEHPLIELYVTVSDEQQQATIEQMLSSIDLDDVVARTLRVADVTRQVMLTLMITDEEGIREMNSQYRQQDKPTDVLSFPLLEKPLVRAPEDQLWPSRETDGSPPPVFVTPPGTIMNLGDIVMSWPTIVRQALEAAHSSRYELLYLLVHGVLHLIGYDDQTEAGYQAMIGLQEAVLKAVGQEA